MHMVKKEALLDINGRNDHIAQHVKEHLEERHIFAVNIMGAPGAGKTTSLENLIRALPVKSYVIEGDIESDIDTERLKKQGISATQINTFGACHLDAPLMHNAVHNMEMDEGGILFIENVGNLVCPAEFSIGEHIKMLIVSVTDGSLSLIHTDAADEEDSVDLGGSRIIKKKKEEEDRVKARL